MTKFIRDIQTDCSTKRRRTKFGVGEGICKFPCVIHVKANHWVSYTNVRLDVIGIELRKKKIIKREGSKTGMKITKD